MRIFGLLLVVCMQCISPGLSFMQPFRPKHQSTRGPMPLSSSSHSDNDLEAIKIKVLTQIASHRQGALQQIFGRVPEDGLDIEYLPNGHTNYCFKVFEKADPSNALFVKHATDFARGFDENEIPLGRDRVKYEYEGYQEFGKHFADMIPRVHLVDEEEGLLVCEYLSGYTALADFLTKGQTGHAEVPSRVAKLLGRCHAMSSGGSNILDIQERFTNQGHIDLWNRILFEPLLATLNDPEKHIPKEKSYLIEPLQKLLAEEESTLKWAVTYLQEMYNRRKESLVHGDVHANNLLLKQQPEGDSVQKNVDLKMIDAEKSMMGPAGIDMGQFLANFAVYMAQYEGQPKIQTSLSDAMVYSWAHYEREYLNTMSNNPPEGVNMSPAQVQDRLRRIFNDAIGFMGLWILYLTTTCPVEVLRLNIQDEHQIEVAQTNLLRMSAAALHDFQKYQSVSYTLDGWNSVGVDTPAMMGGDESLLLSPKAYETGGRNRASMGIAGNNMHHIIELLRHQALPLPAVRPKDPRTQEQIQQMEEQWMQENILQDSWATKPKDIEVWDPVSLRNEKSSPLYQSLITELTSLSDEDEEVVNGLMDKGNIEVDAAAAAITMSLEEGRKEAEAAAAAASAPPTISAEDMSMATYMNFGSSHSLSFKDEPKPTAAAFQHQQRLQQQQQTPPSSSSSQQQKPQPQPGDPWRPLPFLFLEEDDEDNEEFDDGFGNPNFILFGGSDGDDEPPAGSKQPPPRNGGGGGSPRGGSAGGAGGRTTKRQSWGSRGGKGGAAGGGGKGGRRRT